MAWSNRDNWSVRHRGAADTTGGVHQGKITITAPFHYGQQQGLFRNTVVIINLRHTLREVTLSLAIRHRPGQPAPVLAQSQADGQGGGGYHRGSPAIRMVGASDGAPHRAALSGKARIQPGYCGDVDDSPASQAQQPADCGVSGFSPPSGTHGGGFRASEGSAEQDTFNNNTACYRWYQELQFA